MSGGGDKARKEERGGLLGFWIGAVLLQHIGGGVYGPHVRDS